MKTTKASGRKGERERQEWSILIKSQLKKKSKTHHQRETPRPPPDVHPLPPCQPSHGLQKLGRNCPGPRKQHLSVSGHLTGAPCWTRGKQGCPQRARIPPLKELPQNTPAPREEKACQAVFKNLQSEITLSPGDLC